MKFQISITKKEHDNTIKIIMVDPCTHMECGEIDCDKCPLQQNAIALRKEQERFMRALNEIEVEDNG